MNVNGISNQTSTYAAYKSTEQKAAATETEGKQTEVSAVYEPSAETEKTDTVTAKQKNEAIISRLKADAEARTQQLQQLVQQMISKQGNAYGQANDMWKFLASGNFTVDAQTKAQAQADIAEDGYWGVKQTSERIFDFAKALSGGDMDKMKEMQAAFEKGFKQATKTLGKELPQISQDTRSAVNKLFEDFYAGDQKDTE